MNRPSPFGTSYGRGSGGGFAGGFGSGAPASSDIIVLLAVVFVSFLLQFFDLTAILPSIFRLTPLVAKGFVWQLVSYPFVGFGPASLWFLLELLILYWFGKDVFHRLGRRGFWTVVLQSTVGASVVAVALNLVATALGAPASSFLLMQGQHMLLTILIAAFATLYGEATILLFFVIPLKARWFLWLEILFALFGYLNTKDLPGFVGVCVAVLLTFAALSPGGLAPQLRRWRLRMDRFLVERRLARLRSRRRFDVIDGDDRDPWVH